MFESAPLTWHTFLTAWSLPSAWAVIAVVATGSYLWGVARTGRWPKRYTLSFLLGIAFLVVALGSSVNSYSGVLFSMHMAQHLLLITVVPALLVLGHPLELLRRTTSGAPRRVLGRIKHSPITAVLTHPLFGVGYYAAVVVGTHLTPFLQGVLTSPGLHTVEVLLYLTGGYLQLLPILGNEPIRRHLAHFTRLVVLMGSMVVDTVVGVTLLMTPRMPWPGYAQDRPWGPSPATDLNWGGAAMWVGGDTLMAALAIVVIAAWVKAPGGVNDLGPWLESARRSALAGTGSSGTGTVAGSGTGSGDELAGSEDIDSDDEALRAYNDMLARLAERDRHTRGPPT